MMLPTALAVALVAASATGPELCVGFDNRIASDMRIHESDLTQSAAVEALERLKGMIERGSLGGEFKLGALNQRSSTATYCFARLRQTAWSSARNRRSREIRYRRYVLGSAVRGSGMTDSSQPAPDTSFKRPLLRGAT